METTEDHQNIDETNLLSALKRKSVAESSADQQKQEFYQDSWKLFKCRKFSTKWNPTRYPKSPLISPVNPDSTTHLPEKFRVRLEICSPDSFSVTPEALKGFVFLGEDECLRRLNDILADVMPSHYTQNLGGGKACVYKIKEYDAIFNCLKNTKGIEVEGVPWITFNVMEKLSHSFVAGRWMPCRPEHLSDEQIDELIGNLPRTLVDALLPFQLDGLRFGLQRGGRCLIADEMGLGKTLQAIAIAGCFISEGSILVVCPAILRFSWAEELERWLPSCLPSDIHLVFGHKDNPAYLPRFPRVVVISYTMLHHLRKTMLKQEWALLIVDESHHLRCSKKKSEPEEIKAVLNVAKMVKRIVLLSGTPSLSRPYDIFHQIDMLWPGLLGKSKFEFAKTYCDVKFVQGPQGNIFQDFSKGIRLEELNVLLKQTVMIRRLKEHVLVQLPPKRRQIIRLLLKRSDIVSARAAIGVFNGDASEKNSAKDVTSDKINAPKESGGCCKSGELSFQELGIAKLSGFREWLSIHPIFTESGGVADLDSNPISHKMLIFAHHHKVLDGIEEFICEKGISFVRIDGKTLARDRQSAVLSFQSMNEVKVAIIGTTAGGVGLDFSAAQNVVFLELPQNPSSMLQAEDRAHRRGQTSAVNIYIFCAQDTMDESHWNYLNTSLCRVSSTTNGKYDAMQEIEVEGVSYINLSGKSDGSRGDQVLDTSACGESAKLRKLHPLESYKLATKVNDRSAVQSKIVGNSTQTDNQKEDHFQPQTSKTDDFGPVQPIEVDHSSNPVDSLRFEVSQYTRRIHLYSCIPGKDLRPRPLFENFRPEEVEPQNSHANHEKEILSKTFKYNPEYRDALLAFNCEWNKLRPIEQKKLFGKPLQLPLSVELCYLKESCNHNPGGVLKGGSKRRATPLNEISLPLPSNAVWKNVRLSSSFSKKEKEYIQGWILTDEPLCKLCQTPCKGINAKTPEYFEDLFCNIGCYEEYRLRTSNRSIRQELFQLEHGICTICHLDCHSLVRRIKPLSLERRREYIGKIAPQVAIRKSLLGKLVKDPTEGNAWHADHIVPVYQGGGECRLENMRTLCVACHYDVTVAQCAERCTVRNKARKKLKVVMNKLKNDHNMEATYTQLKDQGCLQMQERDRVDDELFVKVPGSAYSAGIGIEDLGTSKAK
ncbi:SNF2_N domain-containing protein/Helicase_C domain-containing protein/HNH domain-containing protein [Cephalotus follicularis]|uniref:SNF2_N domain-containing protein/Helicase_C domain-containing protein/HNH domain-containing protein n=1 Tax=Cephalotus follicularis TaxID=3775 RepID=A0A1Q3BJT1_CEPFO|nr:SNF2_N domain-containing protein/Helicase_C domain-containing protein/HNH domain-containing protein [Cephalotus follicularis]